MAVPLHIIQLKERGGPDKEDYDRNRKFVDEVATHGEDLFFKSKKEGKSAELFNGLAHAVAVLAFVPGGIDIFGMHFEAKGDNHILPEPKRKRPPKKVARKHK